MDQSIFPNRKARRLDDAPFADERDRYLRHCAEHGATLGSLTIKRNELLWIAARLKPNAHEGVGIEVLQRIGKERQSLQGAVTAVRRVVDIGRPWLRFLGWWREPTHLFQHQDHRKQYVPWLRVARAFNLWTAEHWERTVRRFLRW